MISVPAKAQREHPQCRVHRTARSETLGRRRVVLRLPAHPSGVIIRTLRASAWARWRQFSVATSEHHVRVRRADMGCLKQAMMCEGPCSRFLLSPAAPTLSPRLPPAPPALARHPRLLLSPPTLARRPRLPPSPATLACCSRLPPSPATLASRPGLPPWPAALACRPCLPTSPCCAFQRLTRT
eukprot:353522-Chlamydomonas_euryale.AAC.18